MNLYKVYVHNESQPICVNADGIQTDPHFIRFTALVSDEPIGAHEIVTVQGITYERLGTQRVHQIAAKQVIVAIFQASQVRRIVMAEE